MADIHPASLKDAKEQARQRMLDARALAEEDATQAPTERQADDQDPPPTPDDDPTPPDEEEDADLETDEDDESEADEPDDDADDDGPEPSDEDDDDADDDEPPAREPQQKGKKPSRRSKKIAKLQETIARLEANSADQEERLLKRLQEEQARRAQLEEERRQREAEERAYEAEMTEYLGSDQEYRAAVKAALAGDVFEAEKARAWDERREVFNKMIRKAETNVNRKAAEIYWSVTRNLPGVDHEVLDKDFGTVLRHLHEAGYGVAHSEAQKEIAKRDARIARLEAQLKESKVKKVAKAAKADPVEGGTPVRPSPQKSIYEQAMDPVTKKIDREKFDRLRRMASSSAL